MAPLSGRGIEEEGVARGAEQNRRRNKGVGTGAEEQQQQPQHCRLGEKTKKNFHIALAALAAPQGAARGTTANTLGSSALANLKCHRASGTPILAEEETFM